MARRRGGELYDIHQGMINAYSIQKIPPFKTSCDVFMMHLSPPKLALDGFETYC